MKLRLENVMPIPLSSVLLTFAACGCGSATDYRISPENGMHGGLMKAFALKCIAWGVRVPEAAIDRVAELVHLRDLLRALQINCVIDVGANRGQFASELRGLGFAGRIVSFEPVAREFAILSERFAHDPRWTGHRIALGRESMRTTINVPRLTVRSSLLNPLNRQAGMAVEEIEVRRLDQLFASIVDGMARPRVFLKMDTQGYDLAVFEGAAQCVAQIVGLQSELSVKPIYEGMPHYIEALAAYEAAGFELQNLSVVSRTREGGLLELNCFMKRR
jgi:FkbM family methyltransferase